MLRRAGGCHTSFTKVKNDEPAFPNPKAKQAGRARLCAYVFESRRVHQRIHIWGGGSAMGRAISLLNLFFSSGSSGRPLGIPVGFFLVGGRGEFFSLDLFLLVYESCYGIGMNLLLEERGKRRGHEACVPCFVLFHTAKRKSSSTTRDHAMTQIQPSASRL